MPIPIDYNTKTKYICEYNGIPYDIKHQEAIQQIDTLINTHPNYHTIASQGIPHDEGYMYSKRNEEWSKYMNFPDKVIIITNHQIIINF